jgi:siroheme synthase
VGPVVVVGAGIAVVALATVVALCLLARARSAVTDDITDDVAFVPAPGPSEADRADRPGRRAG